MPLAAESVTHVCLFHHFREAHGAIADLKDGGVARAAIDLVGDGNVGAKGLYLDDVLSSLNVPACEATRFWNGLEKGGLIVAVSAREDEAELVERVLGGHDAEPVNECARTEGPGHGRVKVFQEHGAAIPGWAWGASAAALLVLLGSRRARRAA